jgi:predicted outer membrane protein
MNVIKSTSIILAALAVTSWQGCALLQQHIPGLTMSDANLVSVLDSIDEGEIDAARLAMDKASAPEVRAFAGRILWAKPMLGWPRNYHWSRNLLRSRQI